MSATPARIGFISYEFRSVIVEDAEVKAQFGSLARETEDPMETFFDNTADALIVARERQALQSGLRRRWRVTAAGADDAMAIDYTAGATPLARYVDRERAADRKVLITDIIIDLGRQRAALGLWG